MPRLRTLGVELVVQLGLVLLKPFLALLGCSAELAVLEGLLDGYGATRLSEAYLLLVAACILEKDQLRAQNHWAEWWLTSAVEHRSGIRLSGGHCLARFEVNGVLYCTGASGLVLMLCEGVRVYAW